MNWKTWAVGLVCVMWAAGCAGPAGKPADLPDSYRDFKIYSTSAPDPGDEALIVLTVQMHNEGERPLDTRARLAPNAAAGFDGGSFEATLPAQGQTEWTLQLLPPQDLGYEVLKGEISFGRSPARELYIALQGPDPADAKLRHVERLTARATAVGTYAPRVQIDWWRTHPSSTLDPSQRVVPLLTLAKDGESAYAIVVGPMPAAQDGGEMTLEQWASAPEPVPGEPDLIQAVEDLRRCLKIMGGAELPVLRQARAGTPTIHLRLNDQDEWPHVDAYHLFTTAAGDVVIEAGNIDGLRQGTYGLLTDHLDCHWFLPRGLGEEIPRTGEAVIGRIDERKSPSFFAVSGMSWG